MSGGADGLASVMQQSLNPRKPERSSAHYPDKGAVVAAYKRMVSSTILIHRSEAESDVNTVLCVHIYKV